MNKNYGTGIWNSIKESNPYSFTFKNLGKADIIERQETKRLKEIGTAGMDAFKAGEYGKANEQLENWDLLNSRLPTNQNALLKEIKSNTSLGIGAIGTGVSYASNKANDNDSSLMDNLSFGAGLASLHAAMRIPKTRIEMARALKPSRFYKM